MRHTITLSSNPRMIILILVVISLPAMAVLLLIFAGTLFGIIALAGAAYLDYTMLRFFRNHLKSWVETTDTELKCRLPDGDLLEFSWDRVTAAGYCTQERGRPFLFVYREEGDKLVTVPKEYSEFEALHSIIRQRTPFQELSLGRGETIQERLKTMLKIDTGGDTNAKEAEKREATEENPD
ncbi:MAG: hypothetical protein JSV89_02925 [Spirochaetaceae bacterium]|nr:MAG: hypothetical protein JSV89_02925 [Spirochaetaceae bacterium]